MSELSFFIIVVILCFLVRPNNGTFCFFLLPRAQMHFVKYVYSTLEPKSRRFDSLNLLILHKSLVQIIGTYVVDTK